MVEQSLLAILVHKSAPEPSEVDWQQIADSLHTLVKGTPPAIYHTAKTGDAAAEVSAIFCCVDAIPEYPDVRTTLEPLSKFATVDIRLYETFPSGASITVPTSTEKHYLVFNSMTPDDDWDVEFNAWYADEHIPMLSAVPGWRASKRFRLLSIEELGVPPLYLALHEWKSLEVFGSPEFKAATNTPWRTRVVVERVHQKERYLLEYRAC